MREVRTQARIFGTIFRELPLVITEWGSLFIGAHCYPFEANSNRWLCLVIKFISTWNLAWQKFQCINNRFLFCVRNWNTMPSTLTLWICTITSVEQNRIFTTFFVSLTPFSKPEDFSFPISEQNQVIKRQKNWKHGTHQILSKKHLKTRAKEKREKRIQGVMFLRQQPWLFVDILLKICILHLIVKLKAHCVQKKALYFWKIYHISRKILVPRVLFDVLLSVSFRCFSLVFAVSQYLKSSHQSLSQYH